MQETDHPNRLSLIALLVANAVCLILTITGVWRSPDVLIVYWAESAILGVITVLKMLTCRGGLDGDRPGLARRLVFSAFFTVHFGGFMTGHLVFLRSILGNQLFGDVGLLELVEGVWFGLVALAVSHTLSLLIHWFRRGERERARLGRLMMAPYARIFIMHITVLAGGFLIAAAGPSWGILVVLIVAKTIADAFAHLREHRDRNAVAQSDMISR